MILSKLKNCLTMTTRFYSRGAPKKFTRRFKPANPGIQGKIKMLKESDNINKRTDLNDLLDDEDYAQYESDFMNVGHLDVEHEKETARAKAKLKLQITKQRFFNETEPSFLTFTEKIEIQKLHKTDPSYWSPQRLSESFPASPDIIQKVLKARWLPRTVEKVQKYDKNVIENWKLFRSGQIAVGPVLEKHLEKFKERTIIPANEEYIKTHLLEPKITFATPRNTLFTNFINDFIEESGGDEQKKTTKMLPGDKNSENESKKDTTKQNVNIDQFAENKNRTSLKDVLENKKLPEGPAKVKPEFVPKPRSLVATLREEKFGRQTFSQFLQDNVEEKKEDELHEASLMRDVYKKEVILQNQKAKEKKLKEEMEKQESAIANYEQPDVSVEVETKVKRKEVIVKALSESEKGLLHTYVKSWTKLYSEDENYHECIKIPRSKFKMGMTYRVKDCYYDDDGQFLYRVPGLKT